MKIIFRAFYTETVFKKKSNTEIASKAFNNTTLCVSNEMNNYSS